MKRFFKLAVLAIVLVLGSSVRNEASAQVNVSVSYQTFYDELSPYGRWIDYPDHGYVWVPDAGPGFRPYATNGHWVWTDDYEWMWVSDYEWGWAPFHYGRWMDDPYYGWIWVPGYEWSPAWVTWRFGGDYYGWAPIRPGIHISLHFNIGSYSPPYDYWCFAPRRYITSPYIYNYYVDRSRNVTIINQTTIINNYNYDRNIYRTGPSRYEVERYTGRIYPVRFRESSRPGRTEFRNNEVSVYRPTVQRDEQRRFAPRSFERVDRQGNNTRTERGNSNTGRIERNTNDTRRNERVNNGGNNLPRREDNTNERFERRNQETTRPSQNEQRRFERRTDENGNGNTRPDNPRVNRPVERQNPGNGNGRGNNPRFERRTEQPQMNQGQERQQREIRTETSRPQRQSPQVQQPRPEQPRMNQGQGRQQRPDVRMETSRPQRQSPQVQQPRQEQPRQFERRTENGNGQSSTENNNGRSNGRKRS
jgi:hypothetical protein